MISGQPDADYKEADVGNLYIEAAYHQPARPARAKLAHDSASDTCYQGLQ